MTRNPLRLLQRHLSCGSQRQLANHSVKVMLVPGGGVEPPRPEGRRILSPLRLPVPPSRHFVEALDFTAYFTFSVFFIQDNDCETVQVNVEVFLDFHRSLSPAYEVLCGSSRATMSHGQAITRTSVRDFTTQRSHSPISIRGRSRPSLSGVIAGIVTVRTSFLVAFRALQIHWGMLSPVQIANLSIFDYRR